MATLIATYDYVTYGTTFCARVGITAGAQAEALLEAACTACDQYLGNPFDGSTAISPTVHPKAIWEGIVAWSRTTLRLNDVNEGLTDVATGALKESYALGLDRTKALRATIEPYLFAWKVKPWL